MKRLPVAAALAAPVLLALLAVQPARAADVGVSVSISQPGVYGRIDIGRFPQPELELQQPVLIQAPVVPVQPVYMWVPPVQRLHWARYCGQYRACGVPVYFVRDQWYEQRVRPPAHDHDAARPPRGPAPPGGPGARGGAATAVMTGATGATGAIMAIAAAAMTGAMVATGAAIAGATTGVIEVGRAPLPRR